MATRKSSVKDAHPKEGYLKRAAFIVGALALSHQIEVSSQDGDTGSFEAAIRQVAELLEVTEPIMKGDFPQYPEMRRPTFGVDES